MALVSLDGETSLLNMACVSKDHLDKNVGTNIKILTNAKIFNNHIRRPSRPKKQYGRLVQHQTNADSTKMGKTSAISTGLGLPD
jgi:hypothetical protein